MDPVLPGRFRIGSAAATIVQSTTEAAAELFAARGGTPGPVSVDPLHAAVAFRSERYLRPMPSQVEDPLTGNYRAADGWVRLHCNYPHHLAAVGAALGTSLERADVAAAVAVRPALDVEEAVVAAGGAAAAMRTRDEWLVHPQGVALQGLPLWEVTRFADAPPIGLSTSERPLTGIRVLDLTHVIAGPVCGRTLAAHGADVLHVGAAHLPVVAPLLRDTEFGKRSAYVDLRSPEGVSALRDLVREADVFIQSYRPGSLAGRGFGLAELAALRPGIVVVDISAWGWEGPWRARRGFDSLAQMATGIAYGDPPVPLPLQFLDHGTGWLAAFGAMTALRRRIGKGGSWHVRVSLAKTGMWLDEQGRTEAAGSEPEVNGLLTETDSAFGRLTHIRIPGELPSAPPYWGHGPRIAGADPPEWW